MDNNKTFILKNFKGVLVDGNLRKMTDNDSVIIEDLFKSGIVVDPSILLAQKSVSQAENLAATIKKLFAVSVDEVNATFHRSFGEVQSKSDFQLIFEQFLHYASTYGGYDSLKNSGNVYVPNTDRVSEDGLKNLLKELVIIQAYSLEELEEKVTNMLYQPAAIKEEDVRTLISIAQEYSFEIDINQVKNKEAAAFLCIHFSLIPRDVSTLLRSIITYLSDGSTSLIIKNKKTLEMIKYSLYDSAYADKVTDLLKKYVEFYGIDELAKEFQRNKPIFLALKGASDEVKSIINKASRRSKKVAKNKVTSTLRNLTNTNYSYDEVLDATVDATYMQLVSAINAINLRLIQNEKDKVLRSFAIRNGKTFIKEGTINLSNERENELKIYSLILKNELEKRLNADNKVFVLDKEIDLTIPSSLKTNVGVIPEYTRVHTDSGLVMGYSWDKDFDLDLHAVDINGQHFGWNSSFKTNGFTFTGDMTSLNGNGLAAEFVLTTKSFKEPLIYSSVLYNSYDKDNKAKLIIGNYDKQLKNTHSMSKEQLELSSVIVNHEMEVDYRNQVVGMSIPTKNGVDFIFFNKFVGGRIITEVGSARQFLESIIDRQEATMTLKQLLLEKGAKVVYSTDELNEDDKDLEVVDMRLQKLQLDSFNNLFSTDD